MFPFKLISHNSDLPVDGELTALCTDKIQAWFAQNNTHVHEKVVPIPIGLENLRYYKAGIPRLYDALRTSTGPRKDRILFGFSMTHPVERAEALENAQRAPCSRGSAEAP